jgi:predicted DCC family thiol-disulfide oxidoreductase YuxK
MTDGRLPVLLYDGECSLCNAVVRFMIRHDATGRLHFGALQGAPAQEYLRSQGLPTQDFSSLVFVPAWKNQVIGAYRLRTTGALEAFALLDRPWNALSWLRVVPAALRDPAYTLIAKTRYALFGKYRPRPLAHPEWEERFLPR